MREIRVKGWQLRVKARGSDLGEAEGAECRLLPNCCSKGARRELYGPTVPHFINKMCFFGLFDLRTLKGAWTLKKLLTLVIIEIS